LENAASASAVCLRRLSSTPKRTKAAGAWGSNLRRRRTMRSPGRCCPLFRALGPDRHNHSPALRRAGFEDSLVIIERRLENREQWCGEQLPHTVDRARKAFPRPRPKPPTSRLSLCWQSRVRSRRRPDERDPGQKFLSKSTALWSAFAALRYVPSRNAAVPWSYQRCASLKPRAAARPIPKRRPGPESRQRPG
jgi:hypothetical protein